MQPACYVKTKEYHSTLGANRYNRLLLTCQTVSLLRNTHLGHEIAGHGSAHVAQPNESDILGTAAERSCQQVGDRSSLFQAVGECKHAESHLISLVLILLKQTAHQIQIKFAFQKILLRTGVTGCQAR